MEYEKDRKKRSVQYKKERTKLEMMFKNWLENIRTMNFILLLILMVLLGIFINMVVVNISG